MKEGMIGRLLPAMTLPLTCWAVFLVNNVLMGGNLTDHGIIPRHTSSLPGILWSPFLHVSLQHLVANTLPLLILGLIICARGKGEFGAAVASGILLGGGLTWLFARTAVRGRERAGFHFLRLCGITGLFPAHFRIPGLVRRLHCRLRRIVAGRVADSDACLLGRTFERACRRNRRCLDRLREQTQIEFLFPLGRFHGKLTLI